MPEDLEDDFVALANEGAPPAAKRRATAMPRAPRVTRGSDNDSDEGDEDSAGSADDDADDDGMPSLEPVRKRGQAGAGAGAAPAASRTNTLLDDHFEQVAKAYDDDDIGELDAEDPRARGALTLDSFGDVLDEFLESRQMRTLLAPDAKVVPRAGNILICMLTRWLDWPAEREAHHSQAKHRPSTWRRRHTQRRGRRA